MRVEFRDFHGLESYLKIKGYKKYDTQKYKHEDLAYWKSFDVTFDAEGNKLEGYQIGLLFYDTSKYDIPDNMHYGVQFEFIGGDKLSYDRVEFSVSDNINVYLFEDMCQKLYDFLKGMSKTTDIKDVDKVKKK